MTKMRCFCDHIISDSTDNLPYKAHVLPDEDVNGFGHPEVTRQMEYIAESIERWQRGEEQPGPFPRTYTSLSDLLKQSFTPPAYTFGRTMYECENCGRLWIKAVPDRNYWLSYLPEQSERGVLRHDGVALDE